MSYTITEEQIKSIAEGGGKKKIKEMFPQFFGNKIEVGKWYKMKEVNNRCIFYVSRINDDKMFGYGLSYSGYWFNHNEKENGHIGNPNCNNLYFLATNEEVEAALIAEAKKRGFVEGVKYKNTEGELHVCGDLYFGGNGWIYSANQGMIFEDGKWAEIIKETPEDFLNEILNKDLTCKIDKEKYPNSIFYFDGETFLLELEKTENNLYAWVSYSNIWCPISAKNNWDYDQTQAFLKERIEEHFKLRDDSAAKYY